MDDPEALAYSKDTEEARAARVMDASGFRDFFERMGFSRASRLDMTKAILQVAENYKEDLLMVNGSILTATKSPSQTLSFGEGDRKVQGRHNRPLYVTALLNGVEFKREMIDGGAAVNVVPLKTLRQAGIKIEKIIREPAPLFGFGSDKKMTLGYIRLDLKVGKISSSVKFHVIDADTTYHILLGRVWLHRYDAVPSTAHQCMKAVWRGDVVEIPASTNPFGAHEVHLAEATFWEELDNEQESAPLNPIPLPRWEDVKDQSTSGVMILRKEPIKLKRHPAHQERRRHEPVRFVSGGVIGGPPQNRPPPPRSFTWRRPPSSPPRANPQWRSLTIKRGKEIGERVARVELNENGKRVIKF